MPSSMEQILSEGIRSTWSMLMQKRTPRKSYDERKDFRWTAAVIQPSQVVLCRRNFWETFTKTSVSVTELRKHRAVKIPNSFSAFSTRQASEKVPQADKLTISSRSRCSDFRMHVRMNKRTAPMMHVNFFAAHSIFQISLGMPIFIEVMYWTNKKQKVLTSKKGYISPEFYIGDKVGHLIRTPMVRKIAQSLTDVCPNLQGNMIWWGKTIFTQVGLPSSKFPNKIRVPWKKNKTRGQWPY